MEKLSIRKVLIVNRGEIARRIIGTLKKLGIISVALYDAREAGALYVQEADESHSIGSGDLKETFLNITGIIQLAKIAKVDAIHPGYGFLSENHSFARECINAGIIFIGPKPETIKLLGDKKKSLELALKIGLPVIPGLYGQPHEILEQVNNAMFPCLIKSSGGGGGKAMRRAEKHEELDELISSTANEAGKYFVNSEVFLEKYIENPRHIEVQIIADKFGTIGPLGERECSIQRRFQKIIEETPASCLNDMKRNALYTDAIRMAGEVGYIGVGTVEFLLDRNGNHYFLEVNPRLQVEHAITEEVYNIDLVEEQIRIAEGHSLSEKVLNPDPRGHAIECRIYAEDPKNNFFPADGKVEYVHLQNADHIRIDSDLQLDQIIYTDFDPLLAKLIAWDTDRNKAISRMLDTLNHTIIHGVVTNLHLLESIMNDKHFISNRVSTHFITERPELLTSGKAMHEEEFFEFAAAGLFLSLSHGSPENYQVPSAIRTIGYWRIHRIINAELDDREILFNISESKTDTWSVKINGKEFILISGKLLPNYFQFSLNGKLVGVYYSLDTKSKHLLLSLDSRVFKFIRKDFLGHWRNRYNELSESEVSKNPAIIAPLAGKIVKLNYASDEIVEKGDTLIIIESMKMENEIRAMNSGKIKKLAVKLNDHVREGDLLLELELLSSEK